MVISFLSNRKYVIVADRLQWWIRTKLTTPVLRTYPPQLRCGKWIGGTKKE
jgi:hypothetical protein